VKDQKIRENQTEPTILNLRLDKHTPHPKEGHLWTKCLQKLQPW